MIRRAWIVFRSGEEGMALGSKGALGPVRDAASFHPLKDRRARLVVAVLGLLALGLAASCARVSADRASKVDSKAAAASSDRTGDFTVHFVPTGYVLVSSDIEGPSTVQGLPGPVPTVTVRTQFFSNSLGKTPKGEDAGSFQVETIVNGSPSELIAEVAQSAGARQISVQGTDAMIASPNGNPELLTIAWAGPDGIVVKVTGRNVSETDLLAIAGGVEVR